jgi:hypothetical protein
MKQMWIGSVVACVMLVANAAAYTSTEPQMRDQSVPSGETVLGTVAIPRAVTADGKPLPAGTYTLRLTAQTAAPPAPGLDPNLERWVEFLQGKQVRGRELVSIVPADEVKDTVPGPDMPGKVGRTGSRVDLLKGGEYLRVWIARGGHNYFIHLPPQATGK